MVQQAGHGEGLFVEDEHGEGDADDEGEHDEEGGEAVAEDFDDEPAEDGFVVVFHETDEGEDGFVGVHAGDHGQEGGEGEYFRRAVDNAGGGHAEQADGKGGDQGGAGQVEGGVVEQVETAGVPDGGQKGGDGYGAFGGIGDDGKTDGGNGCKKAVGNDGKPEFVHMISFPKISKVTDRPRAMQMMSIVALMARENPTRTCPSRISRMELISGTPGIR